MNCDHLVGREWELCTGNCPPERPCTSEQVIQYQQHYAAIMEDPSNEQEPSFLDQVMSFGKAFTKHAVNGFRQVTEEEYQRRLSICTGNETIPRCEYYRDEYPGGQCGKCKCGLKGKIVAKLRWSSEGCPLGKWHSISE